MLRQDPNTARHVLIDLGVMCRGVASENGHAPDGLLYEEHEHVPGPRIMLSLRSPPQGGQSVRGPREEEVMDVGERRDS